MFWGLIADTRTESDVNINIAMEEYRAAQRAVREEVERLVHARDRRALLDILSAPRRERSKRFWKHVNRAKPKPNKRSKIRTGDGQLVDQMALPGHLTSLATEILEATPVNEEGEAPVRLTEPSGITTNCEEIRSILSGVKSTTSSGLDGIPASVLEELDGYSLEYIADILNNIADGKQNIPPDWLQNRVTMIEKSNSSRGKLNTYRPITVSSIFYRIFAKILVNRIQEWIEGEEILGEMQNGFRPKRRGDDNLFVITSAIELSRKQKTGLICAFLDATKAYDRIDREKLWSTLLRQGMNPRWVDILRALYSSNKMKIIENGTESDWVSPSRGLKQGCPLSSVLFMLYIADLETRLRRTGAGFLVRTTKWQWDLREKTSFKIPALFFADDIVLMATTEKEMRKLLLTTGEFGDEYDIAFNPAKSAVVVFASTNNTRCTELTIQGKPVPSTTDYKYLGIHLSDSSNYLAKQEAIWERQALTALHRMHATSIWGFNRFEVSRAQWKATAVPQLTYGNSVTVTTVKLRETLERRQRDAGRWALGLTAYKVANEFISGELGWSSFEAREAQSKLKYMKRIESMPQHRWPKAVLEMMTIVGIKTKMWHRTQVLADLYNCEQIEVTYTAWGEPCLNLYNTLVKKRVRETQEKRWRQGMMLKSSLDTYRQGRKTRGVQSYLYGNRRGDVLLALARAGILPAKHHRKTDGQQQDRTCRKCGMYEETVKHIIFECNDAYFTDEDFLARLGLLEEMKDPSLVTNTKKILENWERETDDLQ